MEKNDPAPISPAKDSKAHKRASVPASAFGKVSAILNKSGDLLDFVKSAGPGPEWQPEPEHKEIQKNEKFSRKLDIFCKNCF